jgi:hypothetical protein
MSMMSTLLLPAPARPGSPISARAWNDVLQLAQSLPVQLRIEPPQGNPPHPWRVSVSRMDEDMLRIDVSPGTVNDQPATIPWRVDGDARGPLPESSQIAWEAARDARPGDAWLAEWADRPLYEVDPPYLTLPLDTASGVWAPTARAVPAWIARPDAEYVVAGVVLAAFPYNILSARMMQRRFRVYAGRGNPAAIRQARAGELLQLARLWQVRVGGDLVDVQVEQQVCWNLGAMAVEPVVPRLEAWVLPPVGLPLVDGFIVGINATAELLATIVNGPLDNIAASITSTEFWTQ